MKNTLALFVLTMVAALLLSGCESLLAPSGDWELRLRGTATSAGSVGYEIGGQLFAVEVEPWETAEEIGPKLAALMTASGLIVDTETAVKPHSYMPTGESYYGFIVRGVRQPSGKGDAVGISVGTTGPLFREIEDVKPQ
jgi:phage tail sheath gpL-like